MPRNEVLGLRCSTRLVLPCLLTLLTGPLSVVAQPNEKADRGDELVAIVEYPVAEFEKAVADFRKKQRERYVTSLEVMAKDLKSDGQLESLIAVEAELARVKLKGTVSAEDLVKAPKTLRDQQMAFQEQVESADDVVGAEFDKRLADRIVELTKDGNVDEAKRFLIARKMISDLRQARKPEPPPEPLEWVSRHADYRTSSTHIHFVPHASFLTCNGPNPYGGFAFHTRGGGGAFVEIDLGEIRTIRRIWIENRQAPGATQEDEQEVWDVATGLQIRLATQRTSSGRKVWTAESGEGEYVIDVPKVKARYIRLEQSNQNCIHLSRIKVFAEPLKEK
jgi:hypothetical protein